MRTYVIKEKKKPPVAVAQKSEAKVSGAAGSNVDRSEIRAILRADTDREKKETEVKPRIDQDKTPDDSEV